MRLDRPSDLVPIVQGGEQAGVARGPVTKTADPAPDAQDANILRAAGHSWILSQVPPGGLTGLGMCLASVREDPYESRYTPNRGLASTGRSVRILILTQHFVPEVTAG